MGAALVWSAPAELNLVAPGWRISEAQLTSARSAVSSGWLRARNLFKAGGFAPKTAMAQLDSVCMAPSAATMSATSVRLV